MGLAGRWEHWSLLEPLSVELVAVEISSLEISFVRTDLKNRFHRRRQTVKTQFPKDDVETSDPLIADLFGEGVDGDDGV
jgi:hypothetical protein